MRARFTCLALGLLLTRSASAAASFTCGTGRSVAAFGGQIDCSQRPPLALTMTSSTLAIAVHYAAADAVLAQVVLDSAEIAWNVTTGTLGFEPPPTDNLGGGDARFDFYLEASQFGGYFCPEAPTPAIDRTGYYGWVSVNPEAFDETSMPAVVAHELNHASQLGVDVIESYAFMEMTSAYVMEKVFDDVNLAAAFIPYFQAQPESALDYYVYAEPYQYGASLFLFWLFDEKLGNPALLSQVWDDGKQPYDPNFGNEPDVFDVLDDMAVAQGSSLEEWYVEFAADRWFTGTNSDGTFTEGETYSDVSLAGSYGYSAIPRGERSRLVGELGASYVQVDGTGAPADAEVALHFDGDQTTFWSVLLVRGFDGSRGPLALDANGDATFALSQGRNTVVFVNEGDANKDPDAHFETNDWDESSFSYSLDYLGDGGAGCGCALGRTARPSILPLLALALLLRRKCA